MALSHSHMLKHCIDKHEEEEENENKAEKEEMFGVRILRYSKSSFERQILESVLIQESKKHHILNSKSEYNRCAVPIIATKI